MKLVLFQMVKNSVSAKNSNSTNHLHFMSIHTNKFRKEQKIYAGGYLNFLH